MFERMAEAIGSLDVPVDGDALSEVLALRDRLDARISAALGEFDAAKLWELDGAISLTGWMKQRAGMTARAAGSAAGVATRLHRLPATRQAWEEGSLSGGQVAVIAAAVRAEHEELFAEQEADVIGSITGLDVRDTARVMRHWAELADAVLDPPPAPVRDRSLRASRLLDDRVVLDADLDADSGEVVLSALRLAESADVPTEARTPAQRRADALVDICRFFLDHQTRRTGARHRPHVNVVVEVGDLYALRQARYLTGTRPAPGTAAAILCDAVVHRTVVDPSGAILDYGRATRTISAALWSALVVRDQGCRFPGCDRETKWCEAHHVVWFSEGGETSIWNLVLLCTRHHHLLHDNGWQAQLLPDATFEVTHPSGVSMNSRPPRAVRFSPEVVPRN